MILVCITGILLSGCRGQIEEQKKKKQDTHQDSTIQGRQLFVDNFLIESTSLKRVFYYPEYSSANPILQPDKDWEKMGNLL